VTTNHYEHFVARLQQFNRTFTITDEWAARPHDWQRDFRTKLIDLLGVWPATCPPEPRWEKTEDRSAYALHRVTYTTEPGLDTYAWVAIPHNLTAPTPAVLAIHGHGVLGADPVMNAGPDERLAQQVAHYEYDFGHRLAEQGMIVLAPSLRGFGSRLSAVERNTKKARDTCDVNFFQQMLLGEVAITSQLHDLRVALDLLTTIEHVNPDAIGCAGLSYGGRMTMFFAAIETRIKASIVSGSINSFIERIESYASCGYQVVPGLLRFGDVGDVLALIAPRPLAIECGRQDPLCPEPQTSEEFARIEKIYAARNARDNLARFDFEGAHVFRGDQSIPWLLEQLRSEG